MAVTNSTIDMTWTAATDNVGVVSYHIYQSTDNVVYTEIHSTDGATYAYTAMGLSEGTKYYFKQTAKDAAGNESLYGNTVEATTLGGAEPSYLFSDTFAGTTIDPAKWTVINPNSSRVTFEQDDELQIIYHEAINGAANTDGLVSPQTFSNIVVCSFDITTDDSINNEWQIGITSDGDLGTNNNKVGFFRDTVDGRINMLIKIGGSTILNTDFSGFSTNITRTLKVVFEGGDIKFYIYSSGWQLKNTTAQAVTGSWGGYMMSRSLVGNIVGDMAYIDNYFLTDADYDTQYPDALSSAQVDAYLIEQADLGTINTVIDLSNVNPRTTDSDTAVTTLINNGNTVITA